jgi:hypothetical protein
MSFNPKLEFEKLKLLYPGLNEPPTMSKFDKDYFYMYFGPMIDLGVFMKNVGIEEDLAFVANKYGRKGLLTKIIIKYLKNIEKMKLEILKHIFFNTANRKIDTNDLIFMTSYKYFRNITPTLLRLIRERCENVNVSMIAFNYLEGVINEADILSILVRCNGFCNFGFGEPNYGDIKRLYAGITNEKLKFIEFFCTKTNIDCVKGTIGFREMVNSDMTPFHIAIWQCGFSLCDIINFYLENNISSLPTPLNWISFLRIPLKFLCEIDCINLLTRNPATLLSTTALPAFVKKVLTDCNPAVCTVISSRSGISSVLSGTGLDFILTPGRFLCETVCCGSGSTSICNCCKTLRIRDLKNKFSIYKKMAICMVNFLCEMTKKAEFMNDVFALNELRQIIMFICGMIQDPNLQAILNEVSNIANAGIKAAMEELERTETITFDKLFGLLIGDLHCLILREMSKKFFGSEASSMISWVCDRFSEPARCMLKKVIRTVDITTGRPSVPDIPGMIFDCLSPCDIIKKVVNIGVINDICTDCIDLGKNIARSVMKSTNINSILNSMINDLIMCVISINPCKLRELSRVSGLNFPGGYDIIFTACEICSSAVPKNISLPPTAGDIDRIYSNLLACNPCETINRLGGSLPSSLYRIAALGCNSAFALAAKIYGAMRDTVVLLANEGVTFFSDTIVNWAKDPSEIGTFAKNTLDSAAKNGKKWAQEGISTLIKGGGQVGEWAKSSAKAIVDAGGTVGSGMKDAVDTVGGGFCSVFGCGGGGCFIGNTAVHTVYKGIVKIKDIQPGDKIVGYGLEINTVLKLDKFEINNNTKLYKINNNLILTDDHPIMTIRGYKSINPEKTLEDNPRLNLEKLVLGDRLLRLTKNGTYEIIIVNSIIKVKNPLKYKNMYNIIMEGNNSYHVNGYVAHNIDYAEDNVDAFKKGIERLNEKELDNIGKMLYNNQNELGKILGNSLVSKMVLALNEI